MMKTMHYCIERDPGNLRARKSLPLAPADFMLSARLPCISGRGKSDMQTILALQSFAFASRPPPVRAQLLSNHGAFGDYC